MSSKLERWLEWACGESVRILVRNMIGSKKLKMVVVPEPAEGRPANSSLFVAWWRGEKLRASAWNGSLAELVARSSEGDAKHGPLLPGEVDKLQVSVGVVRRGGGEGKQVLLFAEHLRFVGVEETGMLSDDEQEEEKSETAGTVVAMQTVMLGDAAGQEQQQAEKESKGGRSWIKWVLVALFAALLLYMRYNDATYDVKWEVFYSHYAVLGLKEGLQKNACMCCC